MNVQKPLYNPASTEVIYLSDKYAGTDTAKASRRMLDTAGITCRKVHATIDSLVLSFNEADV